MLEALNIIKGAVSTKDLVPVLTHVAVHEGRLHGFNGRVHISALADDLGSLSFTVPLVPFLAAVSGCTEEPKLAHDSEASKLTVSDGAFRAAMPTGQVQHYPLEQPSGKKHKCQGLLKLMKALRPFVGQDASRPWSASIHFQGIKALATNNVVLVESAVPQGMPVSFATLPVYAVDEILRLDMEPTHVTIDEATCTLHYPGKIWLRTTLLADPWPDTGNILRGAHLGAALAAVPDTLQKAVQRVQALCPDAKYPVIAFENTTVSTLDGPTSASVGGFKAPGIGQGHYHAEPLLQVLSVAQKADWTRFPRVPWQGEKDGVPLSGVLLGIRI